TSLLRARYVRGANNDYDQDSKHKRDGLCHPIHSRSAVTVVPPLLVIEVGNSRVKFGVFRHGMTVLPGQLPTCEHMVAIATNGEPYPWPQLQTAFAGLAPVSLIASVNPPALQRVLDSWPKSVWPEPQILASNAELPLVNQTQYPNRVGTDRLLKAVAGNVLRQPDQPLILIDSGTATTVDWVTSSGAFAGGAILPGLRLASQALHDHTAQLPLIAVENFQHSPPPAIGTETQSALQSGIYWGHIGAVRELMQRMSAQHAGQTPTVLITGGGGELLARELGLAASYYRDLTLQGLAVTAQSIAR
ncbi:MAG: type III pantothenate kinase, partial [Planctomycetota bacterium]